MQIEELVTKAHAERRIALVAGESSGDQIAAAVMKKLFHADNALTVRGVGGPALAAAGMQCDVDISALSLRGYAEVIRHLPRLLRLRRQLIRGFIDWPADLFLGVDAPDFNFEIAATLKARGMPCFHLVGPSIWAWRPERKWKIARSLDHLLLLFPFEEAFYRDTGLATSYVGHPMADQISFDPDRLEARQALGLQVRPDLDRCFSGSEANRWFCLLPGSRSDEIAQHAVLMLDVAQELSRRHPGSTFLIPAASPGIFAQLQGFIKRHVHVASQRIMLFRGQAQACIAASDQVLAASGTVCLEAALLGRPMVIVYRMPALSYRWMRPQQLQPWVGLPNILAKKFLVPELIQAQATKQAVIDALEAQWDDQALRASLRDAFFAIYQSLRCDCASRCAAVLQSALASR
ncbi:MAG: lipid-A-disaccharide synthase [Betaproteobacteria bacterium]|jgi:lipid-A-disaccharide synthase|nr:lipid-A-disaccharide synthase [Pseudomonadota bacterium]NBO02790.1 lipid-A-disaccharide synthase [Betaproteobacteria bacterium]HAB48137.1 lipid-A-disaccharide synthase [Lautropia sp.]NBP34879.1 lipid-A-disaccharide synthase [Betaproteobacteria bacterium]NBP37549.1 lipid-A-disaccharide synthase [Betaproteobacteria bacterium]